MRTSPLPRTLSLGLAFAVALVGLMVMSGPAQAVTALGNLAGPSVAATYPSGSEWDDGNNRLVVADTGLDRIEFYTYSTADGTYQKTGQFGTHGTGDGQFDSPRDVAIGGSGAIYVADAGNNRLQKFSETGDFLWTTPAAFGCATCLNTPIGVTWDADNGVALVAATGQNLIRAYDPNGNRVWQSPTGSGNPVAGFAPRDVARGPDGRIWVSDYKHHMVKAFNVSAAGVWGSTTPAVTLGTGVAGKNLGQLSFPYNVDFSLDGTIAYVADTGNNRVARWDISDSANPVPLAPFGGNCAGNPDPCPDPPADLGTIDTLRRVNVDESGNVITADFWGNGLGVWTPSGTEVVEIELFRAPAPGFAQAFGVTVSDDGSTVIGVDRLNQRIEKFVDGTFVREAGFRGVSLTSFSWPEAAAIDPTDGTVWVGDTRSDRIVQWKADLSGALAKYGGSTVAPAGPGEFTYIEDLDVAPNGDVFVADTNNDRIQILPNGTSTFTILGGEALLKPQGVALSTNGANVFVADTGNNRIVKLDASSGALQASYSTGLNGPQGVAVAGDGTVWVADTGNHRIVHLSSALTDLGDGFGSRGTGPLQFEYPHTLDVAQDTLYVADTYNDRIRMFDLTSSGGGPTWPPVYSSEISDPGGVAPLYPAGAVTASDGTRFVADSGGSRIVAIAPGGAQTVVSGSGAGWNDPRDIEFDSQDPTSNVLWVMDTSNSRIVKLGTNGTVLATLGGPSVFKTPYGLSNDATGIYVADTYQVPARVVKIDKTSGNIIWSKSSCSGTAFKRPRDVAVGPNGDVFVADTDNNRIVRLDAASGTCLSSFGSVGSGNGQFRAPRSLTDDEAGGLWVTEGGNSRLQHVSKTGAYLGKIGAYGTGNAEFRSPHCVFLDGPLVDVCDTFNYRIQRFSVGAGGAPSYDSTVGGVQPTAGGFNGAFDVAFAPNGQMYTVDWFNHRIQKFTADGTFLTQWGGYGSKDGSLIFPRGVVVTPDGSTVVVTDSENNRIDLFSTSGTFLSKVKPAGTTFNRPYQTALAPDGSYWVADTNNSRILHLSSSGNVLANWNGGGTIKKPRGIAVDPSGAVYVANTGMNRVEKYTAAGVKVANLTSFGTGATQTKAPAGLRIAGSGTDAVLLIADSGNDRVVVLGLSGSAVSTFGTSGAGAGQFDQPQGVAMDPVTGMIAVADLLNDRISRWTT
jgi:DNA-binding beta-propeller fold protein YncE